MSSAKQRHLTFLLSIAGWFIAAGVASAQEASGDPAPATSSMRGVLAGSASTAPTLDPAPAQPATTAYVPPNAAQLIRLLAPIAVFPDTLVAEVLAAASYPDQVAAADVWLTQNGKPSGAALQQALDQQNWDDGVKALTEFPEVLQQMAKNPQWTAALGEAYINDPVDVMNAVQALRQKAVASGNLKSNKFLTVTSTPNDMAPLPAGAAADPAEPPVYEGPAVLPPPQQIVEVAPADPDNVYVPYYDPGAFYGEPIGMWPGYAYAWPAPLYDGPAFGAFAFGTVIAIDIGFGHSWGWHSWHTRWGPGYYGHGWHGPTVVHDNHPRADHSERIVNHFAPHELPGRGRIEPPTRGAGTLANAPARSGFSPAPTRGADVSANRGAPVDFNQMPMPHFDKTMAQRGTVAATRTPSAAAAGVAAREGALASSHYAPERNSAGAQGLARPANSYAHDAGVPRTYASPGNGRGQGFARDTPMPSRAPTQRSMPPQQAFAAQPLPRGNVERGGNEAGGRAAPARAAPRGDGGGGRAGNAGHR